MSSHANIIEEKFYVKISNYARVSVIWNYILVRQVYN